MDKRIKEHLQYLNRYALHLMDARKLSHEEFLGDEIRQASVERFLQLAIENCLNIGNRLLSLRQFEKPVPPPNLMLTSSGNCTGWGWPIRNLPIDWSEWQSSVIDWSTCIGKSTEKICTGYLRRMSMISESSKRVWLII